eukprot:scaffold101188_cov67-Phaeocystis_antarctica.AAC.2
MRCAEQLEVQSLIAAHRATRIHELETRAHELEEETRAQANTMGKCVELPTLRKSDCATLTPHCHSHPPQTPAMEIDSTQHHGIV